MDWKRQIKGKKITMMGLGLLGRGVAVADFLARNGAELTVTDLKSENELKSSLKKLSKYKAIKLVLGEHRLEDFKNKDMIIKSAGVPFDSVYIKEARKNKIQIEMDASLFAKLSPETVIVGVTGTRGKTMTTMAIYEILKKNLKKQKVFLGGNVRGGATLPLLQKIGTGTSPNSFSQVLGSQLRAQPDRSKKNIGSAPSVVVLELDSWQLQGFGESKISPQVSVFTSFMPDHMNYYKDDLKKYFADKANIFKFQNSGDSLFICPGMIEFMPKKIPGILNVVMPEMLDGWNLKVPGSHNQENIACAVEVGELFGIPLEKIRKTIENFKGVEGRLQYLGEIKGVKVYNDNNATTPDATIAGLEALAQVRHVQKKIVLIMGGADKKLDSKKLLKIIPKYCSAVVMLPGSGTDTITNSKLRITNVRVKTLDEAVKQAFKFAKKDDTILFSPAFASFGLFKNEYDRNDQFVKIIKGMK